MSSDPNYRSAAGAEVQFAAFMTAVALFFIGLLIDAGNAFNNPIRVPLIYLFISSFAFFYSALIYANISEESAAKKRRNKGKGVQFNWANALSECLGVYCLGFAFPLVVVSYADNLVFPSIVLGVHILGYVFYHAMGFSILERNLPFRIFIVFTSLILVLYILSVVFYMYSHSFYFHLFSVVLGLLLLLTFIVSGHRDLLEPDF